MMGKDGGQERICGTLRRHWGVALCLLLLSVSLPCVAQDFVLTLTKTPDPILLGSNINYSLSVSNATGFNVNPGVLTSVYGRQAEFVDATSDLSYTTSVGQVVFEIPAEALPIDGVVHVLLELRGTNVGLLTNTFTVTINDGGQTIPASTNVVSSIVSRADLGISVLGPPNGVFPGDTFNYRLLATNAGPDVALGVVVSNPVPANVSVVGASPSDQLKVINGFVLFSAGTLPSQASAQATVSVLATNTAASNGIVATIRAPFVIDTNQTVNNTAITNVPILTPNTNQITVTNLSGQQLNFQTGWIEQQMVLSNRGPGGVDSVRLLVDGLTNQLVRLVNATGTNRSTPYVAHGGGLAPGEQVGITLEYYSPSRSTNGPNPSWSAYGTPRLDLTPAQGDGITVERILPMTRTNINQGRILLEWPVVAGAAYQVVYYDGDLASTNAKGSMPFVGVPASANRVQWLDYGPPRTLSRPTNSARFYKVIQLP